MSSLTRRLALVGVAVFCVIIVFGMVILSISIVASANGLHSIKKWQLEAANRQFSLAQRVVKPFTRILPESSPLHIYTRALQLGIDGASIGQAIAAQSGQPFTNWSLQPLLPSLSRFNQDSQQLSALLANSPRLLSLLPTDTQRLLKLEQSAASPLLDLVASLATGQHRYVIMFLNTNELRPTGGFGGSYAIMTVDEGRVTDLTIEDIYDADGQFEGFIDPPSGVKEFLSGGKGWRLPDSNWWIDYPTSAQQQLKLLALGNRTNIDGLISVNSDLLKRILSITGPVYLPDSQQELTAETVTDILENRPGQFFPGSRQKQQVISNALTQLVLKIEQLPLNQQIALITSLQDAIYAKEIQSYSLQTDIQSLFESLNMTGEWPTQQAALGLVEANVGINKVNRSITRSVTLQSLPPTADTNELQLILTWQNSAPPAASRSSYINYHRLVMPQSWSVSELQINDQPVEKIMTHEQKFGQETVKEVGFVVPIFPQSPTILKAHLQKPLGSGSFILVKQAGVPPTPLLIYNQSGEVETKVWDRDLNIQL